MANAIYDKAREKFAGHTTDDTAHNIDLIRDDIKAVLVDVADYTVDLATHEFLSDIPAGAQVSVGANLANKSTTAGVFDADDDADAFTSVTGDVCEAMVIFKDTGVAATSSLIAYIDTATNLPVTPNGGHLGYTWDSGASKIFKL